MGQHKKKIDWQEWLDAYDLGDSRIARDLDAQLKSTVVRHWKDEEIGTYADNATRQRALELLAEINGRRKATVDVNHSGSVESVVRIYIPDNGRDDAE